MPQKEPRRESVNCPTCRRYVSAIVKGSVWDPDTDWVVILAECSQCHGAVLAGQDVYGNDELGPTTRLWPDPARQLPADAPIALRRAFEEAESCFSAGNYTASAAMTRRFLEAMVNELGSPGTVLAKRIEALKKTGQISDMLFEWATELRITGNRAVHETSTGVSRQDAQDALTFAEALAEHVFTLRRKFEEFKARRSAEPGGPT